MILEKTFRGENLKNLLGGKSVIFTVVNIKSKKGFRNLFCFDGHIAQVQRGKHAGMSPIVLSGKQELQAP